MMVNAARRKVNEALPLTKPISEESTKKSLIDDNLSGTISRGNEGEIQREKSKTEEKLKQKTSVELFLIEDDSIL
jgi:hypothetical protein